MNAVPDTDALSHGWVAIGEHRSLFAWIGGIWLLPVIYGALFVTTGVNITILVGKIVDISPLTAAIALLLLFIAVLALVVYIRNRRWALPAVNLDTSELRTGSKVVPLATVDSAWLAVGALKEVRVLILRIRAGKEARAEFILRDRKDQTLDAATRLVLSEALRRTSITMPVSKDDPKGRFVRYNFPGHLTRDEAVALALDPPTREQPLPTGS